MRVIGTKYAGLDSAVTLFDSVDEKFLALQSDRVSRIKKDNLDIDITLKYLISRNLIPKKNRYNFNSFFKFFRSGLYIRNAITYLFFLKKRKNCS